MGLDELQDYFCEFNLVLARSFASEIITISSIMGSCRPPSELMGEVRFVPGASPDKHLGPLVMKLHHLKITVSLGCPDKFDTWNWRTESLNES